MFKVEMLPAAYGDCILISYGTRRKIRRFLIDAGTPPTWENGLRERLDAPTQLELFVMTHIDADHIGGAIPFLEHGTDVEIKDVWFNGWDHLPKELLSAKQGEVFSTLIRDRGLNWNGAFGGKTVMITQDELPEKELEGGMKLTLLSPTKKKLGTLARKWKASIKKQGLAPGDRRQFRRFLARHPTSTTNVPKLAKMPFKSDTSAPNGSSIALLAEFGGKAILLTGDAHVSVMTKSISRLLKQRGKDRLKVDACKISHHGSRGNTNAQLLDLLDCSRFLISCDGAVHKLPDNETIGRIIHQASGKPQIIFNYDCKRTEAWKKKDLQRRYGYRALYGEDGYYSMSL